ncbi:hypothetical protein V8E54_014119 [Elaphomyces granulatus]
MADSLRVATLTSPPPRQAYGTVLNTIIEDLRERESIQSWVTRRGSVGILESGKAFSGRMLSPQDAVKIHQVDQHRLSVPLSDVSSSCCSDMDWPTRPRAFDDLYDATDDDTDDCPSLTSSRPTSLATTFRSSTCSTNSRGRVSLPSLTIPSTTLWTPIRSGPKSSPVPPTPPPKIPVSSATLSLLPRFVPALHTPPSLDGSVSSDQVSNISAPPTPDISLAPETSWERQPIRVRNESEEAQTVDLASNPSDDEVAIEASDANWDPLLDSFPAIPGRVEGNPSTTIPIRLEGEGEEEEEAGSVEVHGQFDDGVMLPADAMATLRHIPLDYPPEPWSEVSERNDEMWELPQSGSGAAVTEDIAPPSALSTYSFTNLSIPSPGGFFSSLGHRARHTWAFPSANNPPSSATAEQFYNAPWNRVDGEIVEQVVECPAQVSTEDQLTAVPISAGPPTAIKITIESEPVTESTAHPASPESPVAEEVQEIGRPHAHYEYDESYAEELKKQTVENLDRTSIWIAAQESYLAALCETNPANEISSASSTDASTDASSTDASSTDASSTDGEREEEDSPEPVLKKAVHFEEKAQDTNDDALPLAPVSKDSIYWRGFQSILRQSRRRDAFVHSNSRFDAVQSVRLGLADKHINGLMGKYELVQPERPPYKGPFCHAPRNTVAAELLEERAMFEKVEKEQSVLDQLSQSMWAMDALRYLNGGSLLSSPASKRLSAAVQPLGSPESAGKRRIRVLDLGGQAACGWAWHLAHDHPNVKIYTVVTKQQAVNNGIKGPSNHRQVSVPCLWKLPFRDNQFDVISARSLYALLKAESPMGEEMDEFDLCLQECYRCLKPGGYLEFFVMDSEIARAGPYGSAASVEFAFNLKTRGYDPAATKRFLSRLRRGRFVGIKRAWMFLPMGIEPVKSQPPQETPSLVASGRVHSMEAIHGPIGSTADVASMTGLLGGWAWEQWMLKLQMEMGREREKLLEGIGSVFDEGRKNGSGWTCLCGWAMKPKRRRPAESSIEENVL